MEPTKSPVGATLDWLHRQEQGATCDMHRNTYAWLCYIIEREYNWRWRAIRVAFPVAVLLAGVWFGYVLGAP